MKEPVGQDLAAATIPSSGGGGIVICAFATAPSGDDLQLTWETCCEFDTVGFNLYRSDEPGDEPVRINDCLIPAKFPGQLIGATYDYTDTNVVAGHAYLYWVDSLNCSGVPTRYGPIGATSYCRAYVPLVQRTCSMTLSLP